MPAIRQEYLVHSKFVLIERFSSPSGLLKSKKKIKLPEFIGYKVTQKCLERNFTYIAISVADFHTST